MPTLDPEEISALMSALRDGKVADAPASTETRQVTPYDLTSQDRIIRGQMPTLDAINEQVASMVATGLSGRTRFQLRATASPASMFKFADFGAVLAAPGVLCIIDLGPGHGHALLVIEPGFAESLLAAALGDRTSRPAADAGGAQREMTAVEQLVLRRLFTVFTDAMGAAWAPVVPFKPQLVRFEPDPRLANVAPPTDVVIVTIFQVTGGLEGRLQLVIPYAAVEAAKSRLSSAPRMDTGRDARFGAALMHELEQVPVELRGLFGTTTLSFDRMMDLATGDVLVLGTDEHSPLRVLVEGRHKLLGTPCVSGGSMALEITSELGAPPPAGVRPGATTPLRPAAA